ncbi:unnamed protein product [Paramecium pentaurelia]|uniref:Uncharacterized protein n=1 Tax=Paramecium pentaurelia TaxID=43138 RepID=A0A8S1TY17_9CILI|nr:unnamed protein product [Paramecium pentaurelia]
MEYLIYGKIKSCNRLNNAIKLKFKKKDKQMNRRPRCTHLNSSNYDKDRSTIYSLLSSMNERLIYETKKILIKIEKYERVINFFKNFVRNHFQRKILITRQEGSHNFFNPNLKREKQGGHSISAWTEILQLRLGRINKGLDDKKFKLEEHSGTVQLYASLSQLYYISIKQ